MDWLLGEFPPIPADVVRVLHERTARLRQHTADRTWDAAAVAAVSLFEGWRKHS